MTEKEMRFMNREYYVCEICRTEYSVFKEKEKCEKGHKKPTGIVGADWLSIKQEASGYPNKMHILMNNGEVIIYKRCKKKNI